MSRPTDKDFDRLLRRGVAAGGKTPGDDHASAEILAAWSERVLAPAEQRRWDEHFSYCDRCQDELAAFAATGEAEASHAPWWRQLALPSFPVARWAVAGATAVLALSVAIRLFPEAERRMAEELAAPASAPAPAGDGHAPERQAAVRSLDRYELPPPAPAEPDASFADLRENRAVAPGKGGEAKRLAEGSGRYQGSAEPAPGEAPGKPRPARRPASEPETLGTVSPRDSVERAEGFSGARESTSGAPVADRDDAASAEQERAPAGEKKFETEGARERAFMAPKAAARQPRGAGEDTVVASRAPERQDQDETDRVRESDASSRDRLQDAPRTAPPAGERSKADTPELAGALLSNASGPPRLILVASPERSHLWRIGDGGRIEHAAGEGDWTVQASGVESDLLGGMSPMERVCWVVGRGGTILRTVDAETWQRVPSPTGADLVHVFAADADHATVTTTSGESFRTEDGGLQWRALPRPTPAP